jgi:hypothetical protein
LERLNFFPLAGKLPPPVLDFVSKKLQSWRLPTVNGTRTLIKPLEMVFRQTGTQVSECAPGHEVLTQ